MRYVLIFIITLIIFIGCINNPVDSKYIYNIDTVYMNNEEVHTVEITSYIHQSIFDTINDSTIKTTTYYFRINLNNNDLNFMYRMLNAINNDTLKLNSILMKYTNEKKIINNSITFGQYTEDTINTRLDTLIINKNYIIEFTNIKSINSDTLELYINNKKIP